MNCSARRVHWGIALAGAEAPEREAPDIEAVSAPPRAMIAEVLSLHERIAHRLRSDVVGMDRRVGAAVVANSFAGLLDFHETTAWMLRVLLETQEPMRVR